MATSDPPPVEVPQWLKALPLAPEYHPTLAEFQDPISYILKIEPEASSFGICKIVPPLPAAPKKTAIANLNRSFAARDPNPKKPPTFSTRQQQIGFCPRRPRPVQKPVWQSGDSYTLQQFEAKARQFEKAQTKRFLPKKNALSAMEIETLFWKACADKPLTVEYANDMPGSGFAPFGGPGRRWWREEEAGNVGETAWNMRGVSRAKGSLLRFMKEEIPGVTSPMVYVAMMFSWFAWHVEDHDLHSLNYLHMGSGKTWYGVPRDAGLALEEVVRVQGYGGEVNPLVTFTILGEKTTVMSPEVLIGAGIPCCRLVQNAGEFVVTFPGSYHSGFSHGFNCGEAANIATPGWLRYAKEAAIRRASINYPPMVSHFQLLYSLALSLCSRMPSGGGTEPRSSRLKDKKRGGGEMMIKDIFVQSVIENNDLLSILRDKGSSCVVLPRNTSDSPLYSNSFIKSQIKIKPRLSLGLCSREEALEASRNLPSDDVTLARNVGIGHLNAFCSVKGVSLGQDNKVTSATCSKSGTVDINSSDSQNLEREKESTLHGDGLLDQGLLSCVTCGILSFACVAVVHPREAAARYLMSADCGFLNDQNIGVGEISDINHGTNWNGTTCGPVSGSGKIESDLQDGMDDNLINCSTYSVQVVDHSAEVGSTETTNKGISALDLLATAYGDSSESEEEGLPDFSVCTDENDLNHESNSVSKTQNICSNKVPLEDSELHMYGAGCQNVLSTETSHFRSGSEELNYLGSPMAEDRCHLNVEFSGWTQPETTKSTVLNNLEENKEMGTFSSSIKSMGEPMDVGGMELDSSCHTAGIAKICDGFFLQSNKYCSSPALNENTAISTQSRNHETKINSSTISAMRTSDKDSSRMHVFCLEHALEVEKQLQPIGGVHIMLLCHSDYPKIEAQAKLLAEEMEFDHEWKDIDFREATQNDIERIRKALEDEEVIPTNRDWAVKLGINLYYSANLSKSPLYSKQMPYNAVIYRAFGCSSPNNSPVKSPAPGRRPGRQKKIVVAGRWCGKVWMSNQVHPYLAHLKDAQEEEHTGQHAWATAEKKYKEVEMETVEATSQATPRKRKSFDNGISVSKSGKKRKKPLARTGTRKPRCTQSADNSSKAVEDAAEISSVQSGRVLRSCRRLKMKDEADGGRSCRRLKMKDEADGGRSCGRVKIKEEADGGRSCRRLKTKEEADGGQSCRRLKMKDEADGGPSTRLRKRPSKAEESKRTKTTGKKQTTKKKAKKTQDSKSIVAKGEEEEGEYACNIEGCTMSFSTKHDLVLHKKDICPEKGCGKKFFSHKYLVQHRKVHIDDRPLECPWKGCKMRFKWSWARTEHIRVHTGDRPYVCRESGCGQTFRFVSDFSRHKRKTGHSVKKGRR